MNPDPLVVNDELDLETSMTIPPPPLDFVLPGFLAGSVGCLAAAGATGKSFFGIEAAIGIACDAPGGDLLGLTPARLARSSILLQKTP